MNEDLEEKKIRIKNRIKDLENIDDVSVTTSNEEEIINVEYKTHPALKFFFKWAKDHYIGYFFNRNGDQSQAVISIWRAIDSDNFVTSYSLLNELKSKGKLS